MENDHVTSDYQFRPSPFGNTGECTYLSHCAELIGPCSSVGLSKASGRSLDLRDSGLSFRTESAQEVSASSAQKLREIADSFEIQKSRPLSFRESRSSFNFDLRKTETDLSRNSQRLGSSKGFALVWLLALLPLVVTAAFGTASLGLLLVTKSERLHDCRVQVLRLQKNLGKSLQRLMKLNSKALRLRARKLRAQLRLRMAVASANAPLIAAMKAEIAFITAQQIALASAQNMIVAESEAKWRIWRASQGKHGLKKFSVSALAIQADKPGLAPAYFPIKNFESAQAVQLSGTSPVLGNHLLPKPTQLSHPLRWSCAATLRSENFGIRNRKGIQWLPGLVAVKF